MCSSIFMGSPLTEYSLLEKYNGACLFFRVYETWFGNELSEMYSFDLVFPNTRWFGQS